MSSKLYRAIVGIGISLGATSVACLGTVDTPSDVSDDGGSEAAVRSEAGVGADAATAADSATDARAVDATVDAPADAGVDVAVDAPKDAILDAFCDAAWPTTKGSGGPTCGPLDTCADSGPAPSCIEQLGPSTCNASSSQVFPAWCFGGEWECSTGSIRIEQCTCWGPLDAGQSCP